MNDDQRRLPKFISDQRERVAELCRRYNVRLLEAIGASARVVSGADQEPLEFLVEIDEDLPPGKYSDSYFGLKQSLEATFCRPAELITSQQLVNPFLRQRIDSERLVVFRD